MPTSVGTSDSDGQIFDEASEVLVLYNDALNTIDVSDPATFEAAFALTTGKLNSDDRQTYSYWHAQKWSQSGEGRLTLVQPGTLDTSHLVATLDVCLDLSDVKVVDASGESRVDPNRPDIQPLTAYLQRQSENSAWLIASLVARNGDPEC